MLKEKKDKLVLVETQYQVVFKLVLKCRLHIKLSKKCHFFCKLRV